MSPKNSNTGFFTLQRKVFEDPCFNGSDEIYAWIWLIGHAAWKETKQNIRGKPVLVQRGEFICSERWLAKQWKWGYQKVRLYLRKLEEWQKVTRRVTQGKTHITICNYSLYQDQERKEERTEERTRNAEGTHKRTIKQIKQEGSKKVSKRGAAKRGTPLPPDWQPSQELIDYGLSKGLDLSEVTQEAEKFRLWWPAQSGSKALKADWGKTWMTWILRAAERPRSSPRGGAPPPGWSSEAHLNKLHEISERLRDEREKGNSGDGDQPLPRAIATNGAGGDQDSGGSPRLLGCGSDLGGRSGELFGLDAGSRGSQDPPPVRPAKDLDSQGD